jgi:hypothetical protein
MYLTYMEREITIQFGIKKAWLHLLIYFIPKWRIRRRRCKFNLAYAPMFGIFNTHNQKKLLQTDTEIMLTNMYVFYVKKCFMIDVNKTNEIGWFYPEKCFIWAFFRFSLTDPNY